MQVFKNHILCRDIFHGDQKPSNGAVYIGKERKELICSQLEFVVEGSSVETAFSRYRGERWYNLEGNNYTFICIVLTLQKCFHVPFYPLSNSAR